MDLRIPRNSTAARWINQKIDGGAGSVASFIPSHFGTYARILHPAIGPGGISVRWSEVAGEEGKTLHAGSQWWSSGNIEKSEAFIGFKWSGIPPQTGLRLDILRPLCALLAEYTDQNEPCFFGLWDGWDRDEYGRLWQSIDSLKERKNIWRRHGVRGPRFSVPPLAGRNYFLLCGSLEAAVEMVECDLVRVSPSYIWPANHSWFLASDIDLDSTLVGGTSTLIRTIVESERIEAWKISPTDLIYR